MGGVPQGAVGAAMVGGSASRSEVPGDAATTLEVLRRHEPGVARSIVA
jgi:hypothetical protein